MILVGVTAILTGLPLPTCAENEDWANKYLKTTVTESIDRSVGGDVTGRTVVTDTRIEVRRKVTEVTRVDSNGIERVVSRKTDSYDSLSTRAIPIETVIEKPRTRGGPLVAMSVTTILKRGKTQVATYETRDPGRGTLVISKRITTTINDRGEKVTTLETPNQHGILVVTRKTVLSTR